MRLMFKPSKCRSLSICPGKPTDVTFVLTDSEDSPSQAQHIESVHKKNHKFLGSLVTITCNPQDYYKQLFDTLEVKLENIDKFEVRDEHKLAIYERYALSSMRHHFSIHDLHETHLSKLDHQFKARALFMEA